MVRRNPAPRLAGARLPFAVRFFGFLAITSILTDRYKRSPAASLQIIPIRFRLSSQLSRLPVLFIPIVEVHLRLGEQVFGTLRLLDPCKAQNLYQGKRMK
jgi:hypothetical protein